MVSGMSPSVPVAVRPLCFYLGTDGMFEEDSGTGMAGPFRKKQLYIYLLHQPFCCGFIALVLYGKMHLPIPLVCSACIVCSLLIPLSIIKAVRMLRPHVFQGI